MINDSTGNPHWDIRAAAINAVVKALGEAVAVGVVTSDRAASIVSGDILTMSTIEGMVMAAITMAANARVDADADEIMSGFEA